MNAQCIFVAMILAATLLPGCSFFKDDGKKTPSSQFEDENRLVPTDGGGEDETKSYGSGSVVGNALTGNEPILSLRLEGKFIGMKGDALFNFDAGRKATKRVR